MFSGIIESKQTIGAVKKQTGIRRVRIGKPASWKLTKGQSIAIDGICSTVVAHTGTYFDVEYMPETLSKTSAAFFKKGHAVNLERSLTLKSFIDGHLLQGHVDACVRVSAVRKEGSSRLVDIPLPPALMRFVAVHGSIAINGVSLTVARIHGPACTVALIPYTLSHTNLNALKKGDFVNIETDLIARYLAAAAGSVRVRRNAKKRTSTKN